MIFAFREREKVLDIFEMISGLRMNMAYVVLVEFHKIFQKVALQRFVRLSKSCVIISKTMQNF